VANEYIGNIPRCGMEYILRFLLARVNLLAHSFANIIASSQGEGAE